MWSCGLGMCKDAHSVHTSLFKKLLTYSHQAMLVFTLYMHHAPALRGCMQPPHMARLPEQRCADMFVMYLMHFRTHVRPRHEHARAEYMHRGRVCMTVGCKLHECVPQVGSTDPGHHSHGRA